LPESWRSAGRLAAPIRSPPAGGRRREPCGVGERNFYSYNSRIMIVRYFLQRLGFLFIIFALIVPAHFAYATPPSIPCYRYSLREIYAVNQNSLPDGVSFVDLGIPYLQNISHQPLVFNIPDEYPYKLVDGKEYFKRTGETQWYEYGYEPPAHSLYELSHLYNEIPPASYSNTTKPEPIAPVLFSLPAQYGERPVTITGTVSYEPVDRDCYTTRGFWAVVFEFFASLKFW